jgi:hypothetical protein
MTSFAERLGVPWRTGHHSSFRLLLRVIGCVCGRGASRKWSPSSTSSYLTKCRTDSVTISCINQVEVTKRRCLVCTDIRYQHEFQSRLSSVVVWCECETWPVTLRGKHSWVYVTSTFGYWTRRALAMFTLFGVRYIPVAIFRVRTQLRCKRRGYTSHTARENRKVPYESESYRTGGMVAVISPCRKNGKHAVA